jgi:hypothetical protein
MSTANFVISDFMVPLLGVGPILVKGGFHCLGRRKELLHPGVLIITKDENWTGSC